MPEPQPPQDNDQERRQEAAKSWAASFDLPEDYDDGAPAPQEEPRELPPRRADGTFKKPHPKALLGLAAELGIPQDDIDELEPGELDRVVRVAARAALRQGKDRAADRDARLGAVEPPPPAEPDYTSGLDFDVLGAPLKTGLRKVAEQEKVIAELRARLEAAEGREQERRTATNADLIDAAFDALPAQFAAFFGKGSAVAGDLSGEHYSRRAKVVAVSGIDFSKQLTPRAVGRAISAAVEELYAPLLAAKGAAQPYDEVLPQPKAAASWAQGGLAAPAARAPAELPPGRERAVRSVARILDAQDQSRAAAPGNGTAGPEDFLEDRRER